MPPTLPVELISDILNLATSPSEAISAYDEDQKLLAICCRVSKQFRAVAQPMLWSVLRLKGDYRSREVLSLSHLVHNVRILELRHLGRPHDKIFEDSLRCQMSTRFTKYQLRNLQWIDHLILDFCAIASFADIAVNNLVTLTLHSVFPMSMGLTEPLFPGASFPSLRALYTTGTYTPPRSTQVKMVEPIGPPQGQLDMWQGRVEDANFFPRDLLQRQTPVLVTFVPDRVDQFRILRHNMFEHLYAQAGSLHILYSEHYLSCLRILVDHYPFIKSLSLPASLSQIHRLPHPQLESSSIAILSTCARRKIDVIWREYSKTAEDDVGVSRDFWEYEGVEEEEEGGREVKEGWRMKRMNRAVGAREELRVYREDVAGGAVRTSSF